MISIHALLAESDAIGKRQIIPIKQFLSTLSLRRATLFALLCNLLHDDFYPRSPCGERQSRPRRGPDQPGISIHALLAESDCPSMTVLHCKTLFLSTLSLRRATSNESSEHTDNGNFYPRSPCGERRWLQIFLYYQDNNFYPRSPCGERPIPARL